MKPAKKVEIDEMALCLIRKIAPRYSAVTELSVVDVLLPDGRKVELAIVADPASNDTVRLLIVAPQEVQIYRREISARQRVRKSKSVSP